MKTTLKDIQALYPDFRVSQIDSKQMFIVHKPKPILLSYRTVIGIRIENTWYITTQKYSQTTSEQISQFMGRNRLLTYKRIDQAELMELLRK